MRFSQKKILGFTAFEALLASAILAFMTATVTGALMAGRMQSKLARDTLYASMLGHALMDEAMRLPTVDPRGYTTLGPDPGEARIPGAGQTAFDSVKDYSGYADGPNGVTDIAGNAYPTIYQNYSRSVTITTVSYTPTGWGRTIAGMLVTVTVSRDGQQLVKLQRVACN